MVKNGLGQDVPEVLNKGAMGEHDEATRSLHLGVMGTMMIFACANPRFRALFMINFSFFLRKP